jgi:predicted ester cyclase
LSTEENKALFRRYLEEAWNQSNLEVVEEIFDRYVSHQPDGSVLERGPEDVKRFVGEFRSAFPDLRLIIEEQIAEGDKVVSRGTIRGTHQREFRGMAPTGEEMELAVRRHLRAFRRLRNLCPGGGRPTHDVVDTWLSRRCREIPSMAFF